MKFLDKLALKIFSLIIFVLGIGIILIMTGVLPLDAVLEEVTVLTDLGEDGIKIAIGVLAVLMLLALKGLFFTSKPQDNGKNGIILEPSTEVVSQDLVVEFTNIGLGIGFSIIELAKRKFNTLKELKINKDIPNIKVNIATNKTICLTFAANKFLEYLKIDN